MEIPSLSLMMSSARTADAAQQFALVAMKKMLDSSRAEGEALVRLMEQVAVPSPVEHRVDFYA